MDNNLIARLGYHIRVERLHLRYSQEKLAEKSGLHRNYIGMVERGEKNITIMQCQKITRALNITLVDLLAKVDSELNQDVPMPNDSHEMHAF